MPKGEIGTLERGDAGKVLPVYVRSECRPKTALRPLWERHRSVHRLEFEAWLAERDRCRKDSYRLLELSPRGPYPGGEAPIREMLSIFVPKDFDGVYRKGYTLDDVHEGIRRQNREREAMLLAPRGSTKSCLNVNDCVQWLLNAPDMKILILTGEFKLAAGFLRDVKTYFYLAEDARPTLFHALFPEYVIEGREGTSDSPLECPAAILPREKEPSLWVNSITSNLSGWRCDVKKGDDVVTDENCETQDARDKLNFKYDGTENLLGEWGFSDHIGTRYYPDDWYGERLKVPQDDAPIKVLVKRCWTVLRGHEQVPLRQLQPHMVDLWFPSKLTWESLRQKLSRNERQFRCQQLNEPASGEYLCDFDIDALRQHLLIEAAVPKPESNGTRRIFVAWDTAWTTGVSSDYSAGAVGYVHDRRLYVLEVLFGRFKPSELALQIVALHRKWNAVLTQVEKTAGSELLAMEVQRVASRYGDPIPVYWQPPDRGEGAKRNRVKGLETLLAEGRLWFVDGEWIEMTFQQFTKYTGERNRKRKDDIPDAIAYLQRFIPAAEAPAPVDNRDEAQKMRELFEQRRRERGDAHVFSPDPRAVPVPQPTTTEPLVEAGPGRLFGTSGFHL